MAENVRVVVRCRPMNKREHILKCSNILDINDCTLSIRNPNDEQAPAKRFTYDVVYNELAPTEAIYNDVCYALVESVLEGYNATIFAYGQTGCGKTHTMQGPETGLEQQQQQQYGIIARTFEQIFEGISLAYEQRYLVLISYLEIYNETIRDLLSNDDAIVINHALKELPGVGVVVPTLSTHLVHNAKECYDLLNFGNKQRSLGATLMNSQSSRSHTIFTLCLEQIHNDDVEHIATPTPIKRGKLNLVDLAGSERQNKTGAAGERLREATKINLSLSALGNVISALVDGKTKHIPYRDSKLTRLLQDSLGGNTKTLMIACVSPADNNYDETISTLRYAARAKNISNKPKVNEDPKDAKLRQYQTEIAKLKELLMQTTITIQEQPQQLQSNSEPITSATVTATATTTTTTTPTTTNDLQLEAQQRIENIKKALIGGERASDEKLRERRQRRKLAAERRLSALAQALSRVVESDDRDLLQVHYTSITHELQIKNDYLKRSRQKIKLFEQEINDLQAEFQLDRADYLDTIRRLERQLKFYQQILEHALPILRKAGKYWDLDEILQKSIWNDDLKVWKLPESTLNLLKLPPTARAVTTTSQNNLSHVQDITSATTTTTTKTSTSSAFAAHYRNRTGTNRRNYFDEAVLNATQAFTTRSAEKLNCNNFQNNNIRDANFVNNIDVDNDNNNIQDQSQSHRLKTTTLTEITAAAAAAATETETETTTTTYAENPALRDFVTRWKEAYKSKKIV